MRNRFRAGVLASALLLAPFAAVATASAVPLDQAPVQNADVAGTVCVQQFPQSVICLLSTFSASASAQK
ncbi:hypothetical protein GFY24_21835 [Nocardia sp. SYP-A9097]|uniref:hypothetical protein n=1 Tax=Nocardia sp. SYP-A9097 TaxID=2663237 RepID=UPI00129A4E99|nr:hypothetical protein [Nocardia sp. SYP-A9097]MRH90048.1 hypothetical protein [Nocardia sp. SYP-A9097]